MLESVYAENTVPHMLTGKAISRAVHGHLLVVAALHAIIMSEIYNSPIIMDNDEESNHPSDLFRLEDNLDLLEIYDLLDRTIAGEVSAEDLDGNAAIRDMFEKIKTCKDNLSSSRTANLWFQYIEMLEILCKFIKAERKEIFSLHLQAVKDMLPFLQHLSTLFTQSLLTSTYKQCQICRKCILMSMPNFRKDIMFSIEVTDFGLNCQLIWLLNKSS